MSTKLIPFILVVGNLFMFSDVVITSEQAGSSDKNCCGEVHSVSPTPLGNAVAAWEPQASSFTWICSDLQQWALVHTGTITTEHLVNMQEDINNTYLQQNKKDTLSVILSQPVTSMYIGSQTNPLLDSYILECRITVLV